MDEILIEEKRYISSKQASKITGYAKDYVGQLCREGRVPARLVGRSWYVLESAISDHRFGNPAIEPEEKPTQEPVIAAPLSSHLEAPRYTVSTEEVLPSINQLKTVDVASPGEPEAEHNPVEPLQDSWRSWFDRVGDIQAPVQVEVEAVEEAPIEVEEAPQKESEEVNIPVRAIHHSLYQPVEEEPMPLIVKNYAEERIPEVTEIETAAHTKIKGRRLVSSIQMASVMIAAVAVIVAVIGTGYFDQYLISNRQVSLVAGVSMYDR